MDAKRIENPFVDLVIEREGVERSKIPVVLRETYAQCGEDIIVEGLLRARLEKQRRSPESLFYVEIGANHPIATSNTYLLYEKRRAHGVLIEADPALIPRLQHVRPRDLVLNYAISASEVPSVLFHVAALSELSSIRPGHTDHFPMIPGNTGIEVTIEVPNLHINTLLGRYAPRDIDFLCIDCEGIDEEILAALDFERFTPYVVQCEPSAHIRRGARERIVELLERKSYRLIAANEVNLIFVRAEQASLRDIPWTKRFFDASSSLAKRVRRRVGRAVSRLTSRRASI